ncbi:MAG: ABC transporter permease [Planctomycetes bacterium]|nr:ABC transporter permease [Planctomycetota bacterium]
MIGSMRTVRLGIKSLALHKLRSALTTLGILFGVSSVVAMLAVGEGASAEALERIKAMGSTNILVRSQKPPTTEASSSQSSWAAVVYGLEYTDAQRMRETLPCAELVVGVRHHDAASLRVGSHWMNTTIIGTTPDYLRIVNMQVEEGRWLTQVDDDRVRNVIVLGANAAQALFPLEDPLGQSVEVSAGSSESDRYTVVGVLEYLGRQSGSVGPSLDSCAFIPMKTSRRRFGDTREQRSAGSRSREHVELNEIKLKLTSIEDVEPTAAVLRTMLEIERNEDLNAEGDVQIEVPLELLREAEASKRIFNIVLGSIAVISLLVGGIGIMNVMLATVTERTREIGIRRALGAKRRHIVSQFLVETVVLSAIGGITGVGLGLVIPELIEALGQQRTIVRLDHVLLAFGISAAVGVAFGLYPAWRAAAMDPVEALRHE